jgi:hypothetical protein
MMNYSEKQRQRVITSAQRRLAPVTGGGDAALHYLPAIL